MRDQVYRALAERCGGLVARQEALTVAHYQRWLGELEEGQVGKTDTLRSLPCTSI